MNLSDMIHVGRMAAVVAFGTVAGVGTTSLGISGCAKTLDKVEAYSNPHDDANLYDCRARARSEYEDGGKSKAEAQHAYNSYVQCRCEAGLCQDGGGK